ncbi:MAG TPA: ABC transporter substrate-binding protein [Candidatus Aquilonibacter sp.]
MNHRRLLLTSALAVALAGGPPATQAANAPTPLQIPVIASLTGNVALIGKDDQQSLQLVEALVNRQGGVDHHPVHFKFLDDGSNAQTGVQLANQVIASKAPVLIGPTLTQQCNAIAPLVREGGPADYCLSPGLNPPANGYIWSASVSLKDCIAATIRYFRERGLTRLAILSSTDATGQEADRDYDLARALPENKAVEFVAKEHFNLSDVSVSAQMTRIKAAHPQALLTWTVGPAFGTELHAIADAGLDIPILGSNGDMIYEQLAHYKAFMPKELIFSAVLASVHNSVGNGPVKDAQTLYFNAFKAAGIRPDFPHTLGWDPALIIVDAYRHLGVNATAAQIKDYINHLHGFAGINGIYDFRDGTQHGVGENAVVMVRWDIPKGDFVGISKRGGKLK